MAGNKYGEGHLRERRSSEGELEQVDGTPHDWFEGRGPKCTFLQCVDNATGKIKAAQFSSSETTWGYFTLLQAYIEEHGRSKALYTDQKPLRLKKALGVSSVLMKKTYLLLFLVLQMGISFSTLADSLDEESLRKEVETWTDGLGLPIDEGIKETVIILNLLGLKTYQSCEGHLGEGDSAPWVAFVVNNPEKGKLVAEWHALMEREKEVQSALAAKYPELTFWERMERFEDDLLVPLWDEQHKIREEIEKIDGQFLHPLHLYLEEFYEKRQSSYDQRLMIEDSYCLRSVGSTRQILRTEEQKAQKLLDYQEEMRAFTDFLRTKIQNN